jgi:hypothetical protein
MIPGPETRKNSAHGRLPLRNLCAYLLILPMVLGAIFFASAPMAPAQAGSVANVRVAVPAAAVNHSGFDRLGVNANLPDAPGEVSSLEALPLFPRAAMVADGNQPFDVEPAVTVHQQPYSRVEVGVNISTLGIGVDSALILTQYFDARLMGHYFAYNNGRIEVDNVNVYGGIHLGSMAISVDFYPRNAPIRLSAGLMLFNSNNASGNMRFAQGSSFTLNGETFYGAGPPAVPLTGSASLAFHSIEPAPTLTFGFGKFIPRSNRRWSFPSEYGVAFTGTPTVHVSFAGTVCTDAMLTNCSNLSDTSNPVTVEFNNALQARLASWRHSLSKVPFTPILAGGVTYSFDTPWQGKPSARF